MKKNKKNFRKFLSGNEAAAEAVKLVRPDVVFGYPITPSTSLTEELAKMADAGEIKLFTQMESEFGTMSACIGAALVGARPFTATSSQGFLYMAEVIFAALRKRLGIVIVNVGRALGPPWGLNAEWTDSMILRDSGCLQLYPASPQEVLDFVILAYRLAENRYVKIPAIVSYDGFFVSHTKGPVKILLQKEVDQFLPPNIPLFPLNNKFPVSLGGLLSPEEYAEYLKNIEDSLNQVPEIEEKILEEYFRLTGRKYQPVLVYNPKKSKTLIVTLGSIAQTARFAIDERGADAGLVKINRFRPFPTRQIKEALASAEKVIVLDRSFGPGGATTSGIVGQSIRETFFSKKIISAVVGLNGRDVSDERILKILADAKTEESDKEILNIWPDIKTDFLEKPPEIFDFREEDPTLLPGHGACPGCGLPLPLKIAIEIIKGILLIPASCASVITWSEMTSAVTVSKDTVNFAAGPGVATGASQGLKSLGRKEKVILFAGDGSIEIGFSGISGAARRNERFFCIVCNNGGYMNTGGQLSSFTPRFSRTTTSPSGKKYSKIDIVAIMAAHRIPYLATASLYKNKNFDGLEDYRRKLEKAKNTDGFSFILVFSPCPTGWKSDPAESVLLSELAVETGTFPLVEIFNGEEIKINYEPERFVGIKEYLKLQKRFQIPMDKPELIKEIEKEINFEWQRLKRQYQLL